MKLMNEYAEEIAGYDDTPKAVLGALAMSLALRLSEDDFSRARQLLIDEWAILHRGGIVPQPVPSKLAAMTEVQHADNQP